MSKCENMNDALDLWCEPWCEFYFNDDSYEKEQIHVDEFLGNPKLKKAPELEVKPNNQKFTKASKPETKVTCEHVEKNESRKDFSEIIQEMVLSLEPEIHVIDSKQVNFSDDNDIINVVISMR